MLFRSGNLVLVEFERKEDMIECLHDRSVLLKSWFEEYHPWVSNDVGGDRVVWL